jgi:hypothetical protein
MLVFLQPGCVANLGCAQYAVYLMPCTKDLKKINWKLVGLLWKLVGLLLNNKKNEP